MAKEKRTIAGYVRVGLTAEELGKLDEACGLDERCRADFVRIYAIRAAESLLQSVGLRRVVSNMGEMDMQGIIEQTGDYMDKKNGKKKGKK